MTNLEINSIYVGDTQVAKLYLGADVVWSSVEPEPVYSAMPLTFDITGDGYIAWKRGNSSTFYTIEYSKNGGEWTTLTPTSAGTRITVVSGDTLQFRGNNATYYTAYNAFSNFQGSSALFSVKGNIMSLIDATNFSTLTTLSSAYTFGNLFLGIRVTDASNLVLPATALTANCYRSLFQNCTSLASAPALPATTLAESCYESMFANSRLTSAPELPATTLAQKCYYTMFTGCRFTSVELPARTLENECYRGMFRGCGNLNYIACSAISLANESTTDWVNGVASAGTFVAEDGTDWTVGTNGIPVGWATNISYVVLSISQLRLTGVGNTDSFTVTTSKPWSATTVPSWVSLSQTTGASGTTTVTVTADSIPSTGVEDIIEISADSASATITVANTEVSRTTYISWYNANEEALNAYQDVNWCQTLYVEQSALNNMHTNLRATGNTTETEFDVEFSGGMINVMGGDATQTTTEIDGYNYETVDFQEIVRVNDGTAMLDIKNACQDYLDATGIQPFYLES